MHFSNPFLTFNGIAPESLNSFPTPQSLSLPNLPYTPLRTSLTPSQDGSEPKDLQTKRSLSTNVTLGLTKKLKVEQDSVSVREIKIEEDDDSVQLNSTGNDQSHQDASEETGDLTLSEGLKILKSQQLAMQFMQQQAAQQAYRRCLEQIDVHQKQRYMQHHLAQQMQQRNFDVNFQQKLAEQMGRVGPGQHQNPIKNGIQPQYGPNLNFKSPFEMMRNFQLAAQLSQGAKPLDGVQTAQALSSQKYEEEFAETIKQEHIKIENLYPKVEEGSSTSDKISFSKQVKKEEAKTSKETKKQKNEKNPKKTSTNNKIKKLKGKKKANNYMDYFKGPLSIQMLLSHDSSRPRRKNRWQQIAQGDLDPNQTEGVPNEINNGTDLPGAATKRSIGLMGANGEVRKSKSLKKLLLAQQSLENEKNMDYAYLLSITIMKDPSRVETSGTNNEFIVTSMYDRDPVTKIKSDMRPKTIEIGPAHQAVIPSSTTKGAPTNSTRKPREPVWDPNAAPDEEIAAYFNDLNILLNCEDVHQERALKLLKRKEYMREKVRVNISKNEKFYSSFLVLPESRKINHNC